MTELCLSTTSKAQLVFILVFSDLYIFSSFILSHPLYLSYFLFFSPYLFKLLSFLSPLFLTTSLLLFSLVANFIPHEYSCWNWEFSSQNNMGFLTGAYHAIVQSRFRSKLFSYHIADDQMEYLRFEDSEVFKIVFDIPMLINNHDDAMTTQVEDEIFFQALDEDASSPSEFSDLSCSSKESDELESGFSCSTVEEDGIQHPIGTKDKKVVELSSVRNGSEAESNKVIQNKVEAQVGQDYCMGPSTFPVTYPSQEKQECNKESHHTLQSKQSRCHSSDSVDDYNGEMTVESSRTLNYNLGSYGSMRKEKEWKRTLACKLFEERHNVVGGGEGMDMLWETYEVESSKKKEKSRNKNQKKYHQIIAHGEEGIDDGEEEEDDESNGQLCCLQAFKFSTGKMNLGMRKPNLVKITKAIKGLGWLHHQVTSRRSKKVHNGE